MKITLLEIQILLRQALLQNQNSGYKGTEIQQGHYCHK
jgi:hypothetical protein